MIKKISILLLLLPSHTYADSNWDSMVWGTGVWAAKIPTLTEWGIIIFALLILLSGLVMLRKRGMI